jgi:glycosyltransferase involved in cell wall biosynthesis
VNAEVLYAAAHAEFPDSEPLGGGKAVADYLIREWRGHGMFPLTVLSPRALKLPLRKPLAEMGELEYARFCGQFEAAATAEILRRDPRECVILCNDISEGPDYAGLGVRGYRLATIFHVDVVEFFTKFYLHNLVPAHVAARWRWFSVMPRVLRLVFQKQFECVRWSRRLIVPSPPMRDMILRCYPWCPAENIVVLPWGNIAAATGAAGSPSLDIGEEEFVVMTLSRLSPEKGIERLLAALELLDRRGTKLRVFICGGPAYMHGRAYEHRLRKQAHRLRRVTVQFTGHVTGAAKAALLCRADLFVSPSRHESYGLTIAEAMAAGCRVISHSHYGAAGEVVNCAHPRELADAIARAVATGRTKRAPVMPATAMQPDKPEAAWRRLAELLVETPP